MGWREKAHRAKRLHRPTLKDWTRDGLAATFPSYASPLIEGQDAYCCLRLNEMGGADTDGAQGCNNDGCIQEIKWSVEDYRENNGAIGGNSNARMIPVVLDVKDTPPECFHSEYEARCIPVVIRGVPYGVHCGQQQQHPTDLQHQNGDQNPVGRFQEEKKECDDGHEHMSQDMQDRNNSSPLNSHFNMNQSLGNSSAPWPAVAAWSFPSLYNDDKLRDRMFKVGEDDDGYTGES